MDVLRMRRLLALIVALAATAVVAQDDPAVYITAGDSSYFSPNSALSAAAAPGRWFQRKVAFAGRGDTILMAYPGGLYPDLTIKPNLRGRYNLTINMREVNAATGLQLKLSGRDLAYTVTPALGTVDVHT
ncbi:MAG: hypothetical protein KKI08_15015, partial [Armatimonadetes bacterium]|nr:hypothetical protein [Armatimonadota bacterium]